MTQDYCTDPSFYVAHLIEEYLRSHPEAMDSFEGISKWWVTRQKMHESTCSVTNALNILIEKGVIEKTDNQYYRCRKH